jgi:pyoverdine/dityrosine biosynthesis protein Dit1
VDEPRLGGALTELGTVKYNEDEEHITSYKEAMAKIKEATGVSDIQEVVRRFHSQGDTKEHLEKLKTENSQQLAKLREEKVLSAKTLDCMLYKTSVIT